MRRWMLKFVSKYLVKREHNQFFCTGFLCQYLDCGSPKFACQVTGGAIHVVHTMVDLKIG